MSETTPAQSAEIVELRAKSETPTKTAVDFAREHPLLVVAGGIAVGVIAAALLPKGAARSLGKGASALAEIGAAAAVTLGSSALEKAEAARNASADFGRQALDRADSARHSSAELGRRLWESAEQAATVAGRRGESATSDALLVVSETGHRIARKAAELAAKVRP